MFLKTEFLPLYFLDSSMREDLHFISRVCLLGHISAAGGTLVNRQLVRPFGRAAPACMLDLSLAASPHGTRLCQGSPGQHKPLTGAGFPPSQQCFSNRAAISSFLWDLCPRLCLMCWHCSAAEEPDFFPVCCLTAGWHSHTGQTCCLLQTQASSSSLFSEKKAKVGWHLAGSKLPLLVKTPPFACRKLCFLKLTLS